MKHKWSFKEKTRSDVAVDPIQGEFFTTEALDGLADALVREVIQNSLDADDGSKVSVRFWLSGDIDALPAVTAKTYFADLRPHLKAPKSGIAELPADGDPVPFLLIEDFATTGLTGNPAQEQDDDTKKNGFYYFFRNVGRSGKKGDDRGRWGLGKNVFPASSRINSFLALTVRAEDPKRLLMGQSVLKIHSLNGTTYMPYGYFGLIQSDDFALPIEDNSIIEKFRNDFKLQRDTEPGLSVVVPYPDPDIRVDSLTKAVIRQYFYAILADMLSVTVESGSTRHQLDKSTLLAALDSLDEAFRREVTPMLELAKWACLEGDRSTVQTKSAATANAPTWEEDVIPTETLTALRDAFEKGDRLSFLVPITIRSKRHESKPSYFKVFLQRDPAMESHRVMFIREGISVSDAVRGKQHAVRGIVVIDRGPLATLLGDAENPAHTEWQARSEHFKEKYQHGPSTLNFVKQAVAQLVRLLSHSDEEADPNALLDIFFLPEDAENKRKGVDVKTEPGIKPPQPTITTVSRLQPFILTRVAGGFSVSDISGVTPPDTIEIRAAYEVRRGNPLKKYSRLDFEMDKSPIEIKTENAHIVAHNLNVLEIGSFGANFNVTVKGFDRSRDLYVKATSKETGDDSKV